MSSNSSLAEAINTGLQSSFWQWYSGWMQKEREQRVKQFALLQPTPENLAAYAKLGTEIALLDRVLGFPTRSLNAAANNTADEISTDKNKSVPIL